MRKTVIVVLVVAAALLTIFALSHRSSSLAEKVQPKANSDHTKATPEPAHEPAAISRKTPASAPEIPQTAVAANIVPASASSASDDHSAAQAKQSTETSNQATANSSESTVPADSKPAEIEETKRPTEAQTPSATDGAHQQVTAEEPSHIAALADFRTKEEGYLSAASPAIQSKIDEARQLAEKAQFAKAANAYQQVSESTTDKLRKRWAQLQAGIYYERAGQTDKAMDLFDATVSNSVSSWWAEEALYRKAYLSLRKGRNHDAFRAAEFLRMGFPSSILMDNAWDILGQLEEISPEQLAIKKAKEHQASALLRTANTKLRNFAPAYKEVLDTALQIIKEYPDTSAAVSALAVKGEALINLRRYDEAYESYRQLLERGRSIAPHSMLVGKATRGCSYAILKRAHDSFGDVWGKESNPSPKILEKMRADCNSVIEMGSEEKHVIRARLLLAETEILANNPRMAESLAEKLLAEDYAGSKNLHTFPEQVLACQHVVAQAARMQKNLKKALQAHDRLSDLHKQLTKKEQERLNVQQIVNLACFEKFFMLSVLNAGSEKVVVAAQEVLTRSPKSKEADYVRGWLKLKGIRTAS